MAKARSIGKTQGRTRDNADSTRNGDDATARKAAFLSQPANYAEAPATVERIETHMSWVFLAGNHAYKLKKAVHYPYLDFSSVTARRHDCLEELRLNQRLAPSVYLGIVPLTREAGDRLALGGDGEPVDWLVRMRRLSRARMLDNAMAAGAVQDAELDAVVRLLVDFYRDQPPEPVVSEVYRRTLEHDVRSNRQVLLEPQYGLARGAIEPIIRAQLDLLHTTPQLFDDRVAAGRIVEGHGDLRPGHVFLGPPPQIIDCLEFNRALRVVDPLDELGYLAMECRVRDRETVGNRLLARYAELSGDPAPPTLLALYQSRRACLRARLCLRHITSTEASTDAAWRDRAGAYLGLSRNYASALG
ncbi:MAG: hypothetical protein OEP48_16185 [Betaproteobacteria bacterium]|nr:hypothetical protein [Betaproteobacteria bacterium]